MTHGSSGIHVEDIHVLCPKATVTSRLCIFNEYQISTKTNTPKNMGDYKAKVEQWLGEMICG